MRRSRRLQSKATSRVCEERAEVSSCPCPPESVTTTKALIPNPPVEEPPAKKKLVDYSPPESVTTTKALIPNPPVEEPPAKIKLVDYSFSSGSGDQCSLSELPPGDILYSGSKEREGSMNKSTESVSTTWMSASSEDIDVKIHDGDFAPHNSDAESTDSGELSPIEHLPEPKTTRRADKEERKYLRNSGLAYTNTNGEKVQGRSRKKVHLCKKHNCQDKISEEEADSLFHEYWEQNSYEKRVSYVSARVEVHPKKQKRRRLSEDHPKAVLRSCSNKFFFEVSGVRKQVCRSTFMDVLGETDGFIRFAVDKKKRSMSGLPTGDGRGRHEPKHKLSEHDQKNVRDHIMSYPSYVSHYRRNDYKTEDRYLPTGLTVLKMHEDYLKSDRPPVSLSTYQRIFETCGRKVKPPKTDTCTKCDQFNLAIQLLEGEERQAKEEARLQHHSRAETLYELKRQARLEAEEDSTCKVLVFDLEQVLPTPCLTSGSMFYLRQLNVYNLTVTDPTNQTTTCYMWHEGEGERGANEISSCLFLHIMNQVPETVIKLTLFSDSTIGQNRNSIVAAMLMSALQAHPSLQSVIHICLEVGHTRLECDSRHAAIENIKKTTSIEVPSDWHDAILGLNATQNKHTYEVVQMVNKFYDFSQLLRGPLVKRNTTSTAAKLEWLSNHYFGFQRDNPGKFYLKRELQENEATEYVDFRRNKAQCLPQLYLSLQKCHLSPLPISGPKKKDLRGVYELIKPSSRLFYEGLKTAEDIDDVDPDLMTLEQEGEEEID